MREPQLVLAGPTASGKTSLALDLAERHGFEIISIDSRQLYQGMAVGSAAPTAEEQRRVPHHLVDCTSPHTVMTAGDFGRLAQEKVEAIEARERRALMVGGSGMYLLAALGGLDADLPKDPQVRRHLQEQIETRGSNALHAYLAEVDPPSAERIMPRDALRIVRALEVFEITGAPISSLRQTGGKPNVDARIAVLLHDPAILERRIRTRVSAMIQGGLEEEVRRLLELNLPPDQPALKSVGYAETIAYLRGELNRQEWEESIVVNTRRFAKRQRTWFRGMPGATGVPVTEGEPQEQLLGRIESLWGLR